MLSIVIVTICIRFLFVLFLIDVLISMFRIVGGRPRWGVFYALLGSAISLMLFQFTSDKGLVINFLFLFLAGGCSSGPDSIVSGALASEVGERENAQSAVSGIINGRYSISDDDVPQILLRCFGCIFIFL